MKASSHFVVANSRSCIGCKACEVACFAAHHADNGVAAAAGTVGIPVIPRLHVIRTDSGTVPVQCRQCENAPCAGACPVQAIKHEGHAIVIDADGCIGCKNCMLACPFGAISLDTAYRDGKEVRQPYLKKRQGNRLEEARKIVAYKCDLCKDTGSPACVDACPQHALSMVVPAAEKQSRNRKAAGLLMRLRREG